MGKFVVTVTRTETYIHEVATEAKDEREACRKVQVFDDNNGFETQWNELTPTVETEYDAMDFMDTTIDDEEFAELQEVP